MQSEVGDKWRPALPNRNPDYRTFEFADNSFSFIHISYL